MKTIFLNGRYLFLIFAFLPSYLFGGMAYAQDCSITKIIEQSEKDYNTSHIQKMVEKEWGRIVYYETLVLSGEKKKVTDYSMKKFPLRILNPETCETKDIILIKRGLEYEIEDKSYAANIQPFINGQIWNAFNTNINITEKKSGIEWIVIRNKYPTFKSIWDFFGKTNYVNYTPFSENLYNSSFKDELVLEGKNHLLGKIDEAFADLKEKNVLSRAVPDKLIVDVISKKMLRALPLTEQIDPDDFKENNDKNIERVFIILGANKDRAYTASTSSTGAKGLTQVMPQTWKNLLRKYPAAKLPAFSEGTRLHKESIKAAILYFDNSLYELYKDIPKETIEKEMHLILAAAYNGGEFRVKWAIQEFGDNWEKNNRAQIENAKNRKNELWKEISHTQKNKKLSAKKKKVKINKLQKKFEIAKKKYDQMKKAQIRPETLSFLYKFERIWKNNIVFDKSQNTQDSKKQTPPAK